MGEIATDLAQLRKRDGRQFNVCVASLKRQERRLIWPRRGRVMPG
jgi:hypothetical protein